VPTSYLALYRCQFHPGNLSLHLDDEYGGGVRLSDYKCCGAWDLVKSWPLTTEIQNAIADVEVTDDN